MSNSVSPDKLESVSFNVEIGGFKAFIPFLEELLLYKEYLRGDSIWNTIKKDYWQHEKAILAWAYSGYHKHLGNPIDSQRIRKIYGLSKTGEEIKKNDIDELTVNNKNELINDMENKELGLIDPLMGNLVHKGLAHVLARYKSTDGAETSYTASIMISRSGLILGKLVTSENFRFGLLKYQLASLLLDLALILGALLFFSNLIPQYYDLIYDLATWILQLI